MTKPGILCLSLLAACASAPRTAFPPIANMHSPTLCYVEYAGNVLEQEAARGELSARRFSCTPSAIDEGRAQWNTMAAATYQMNAQASGSASRRADAALGIGLGLLLSQPVSPQTSCITQYAGKVAYTTCR